MPMVRFSTYFMRTLPNSLVVASAKFQTDLQKEYEEFLRHEPSNELIVFESKKAISKLTYTPCISIIIPVYKPEPTFYEEALRSVTQQTYTNWELIIVHDGPQPLKIAEISAQIATTSAHIQVIETKTQLGISDATNTGITKAHGEYITFLDHDDVLRPHALERMVSAMQDVKRPPDFLYSDHDKIDTEGKRYEPEFKPDWSPETLLSYCYIAHLKMIRLPLLQKLGGFRKQYDSIQDYDLLLRVSEQTNNVSHIPEILYHWRSAPGSTALSASTKPASISLGKQAVQEALIRRGKRGTVTLPTFAETYNVGVYNISFAPDMFTERVTIVIPTKDNVDLLRTCIESIQNHTQYPNYDILVVNNNSSEKATTEYLLNAGVQYIDVPTNTFNFSKLMNTAVNHTESEYILLLNNDTEVLHNGWLTAMMGTLMLDDSIAAVGAKLLFNDNTVQHAGVILGPNNSTAGHANKWLLADGSGYLNSLRSMRNFSAVTAACLLTRKIVYEDVGGFNEKLFPVSYNDVDYCLKLIAQNYRIVYTPNAVLRHHESKTRKHEHDDIAESNARLYLRSTWQPLLHNDPYYNPNLSVANGCFHLRKRPRGKNILLASHNLEYQGASLFLFELARELHSRDYRVEVTAPYNGPLASAYSNEKIPLHICQPGQLHPIHQMNKDAFDIIVLNTIVTYALLKDLDTHAHPIVWCIHESEREAYFAAHKTLTMQQFSNVSDVLFVSEATRNVYHELPPTNTHIIPNGIDISAIDRYASLHNKEKLRTTLGIRPNEIVITCIGTLCERKGQYELTETVIALMQKVKRYTNF